MKSIVPLLAAIALPSLSYGAIEVADTKGRKMEVEVLAYTESSGNTKIKRVSDGKIFNVKISVFDEDSQKKIKANAPKLAAKLKSSVSVGRRRARLGDSSYMKTQTLTAKITIENESMNIDFLKGQATLLLVARQTKRYADNDADYGKILTKQDFAADIKAGDTLKIEAKPVVTKYDSDRDSSNIGGWEYYGWVLVLQDAAGAIRSVETNIGNLQKETNADPRIGKVFVELEVDQHVEKNLSERES